MKVLNINDFAIVDRNPNLLYLCSESGEENIFCVRKNINILALLKVATCRNFWKGGINERRNNVVG